MASSTMRLSGRISGCLLYTSSLSFDKEYNTEYNITEQLGNSSITKLTKVNTGKLLDITAANYKDAGFDKISEQDVKATEVYRIQLSYNCLLYTSDIGQIITLHDLVRNSHFGPCPFSL